MEQWLEHYTDHGSIWIGSDGERITGVSFDRSEVISDRPAPVLIEARDQLEAFLEGRLKNFDLPLAPEGTVLQKKIWNRLLEIPFGGTITYAALAREFGGSRFARAVGSACGANPIPIIIPCHRVIASDGRLTGYIGGLAWKQRLLAIEGVGQMAFAGM